MLFKVPLQLTLFEKVVVEFIVQELADVPIVTLPIEFKLVPICICPAVDVPPIKILLFCVLPR